MVRSPKDPNLVFLYNSFTDNRVAIEEEDIKLEDLFYKIQQKFALNSEEQEAADGLKELGYLLDDEVDEKKVFNDWFEAKVKEQTDYLQITIVTTMACNLRCTYCFEKEQLQNVKMTPEVSEKVIAWLKTRIEQTQCKKLNLIYFGGEPLINVPAIRQIGSAMQGFCQQKKVDFNSGAITNGVLLTPKLVDELKTYGLSWVKITFDGDKETHDKMRIYKGGRGTFDQIFNNLEAIAGKIKINIGGNFNEETADSFYGLLERLKTAKFRNDLGIVRFKPIMEEMTNTPNEPMGSSCKQCIYTDKEIKQMIGLHDATQSAGFRVADPVNLGPCEFYQRNGATIGVSGKVYKCAAFTGMANTHIGDVSSQNFNELGESFLKVSNPFENPKCQSCHFPPICGGGCRANSYTQTGSVGVISCQQNYVAQALQYELPREYYFTEGNSTVH